MHVAARHLACSLLQQVSKSAGASAGMLTALLSPAAAAAHIVQADSLDGLHEQRQQLQAAAAEAAELQQHVEQLRAQTAELPALRAEVQQLNAAHEESQRQVQQLQEKVRRHAHVVLCRLLACVPVCVRACVCACVHACVRAQCARAAAGVNSHSLALLLLMLITRPHECCLQALQLSVLQQERAALSDAAADADAVAAEAAELRARAAEASAARAELAELCREAARLEQYREEVAALRDCRQELQEALQEQAELTAHVAMLQVRADCVRSSTSSTSGDALHTCGCGSHTRMLC